MKRIAVIGIGTMGSSIVERLRPDFDILAIDKADDPSRITNVEAIILCVKPQSFSDLALKIKPHMKDQTIISIMAGVKIERLRAELHATKVVRTMPNLGLQVGKSLTGAYGPADMRPEINDLLEKWGEVIWLEKEADFDTFTALAGSGPAYIFELVSQLQQAAEEYGFDVVMARRLANATLQSAAASLGNDTAADKVRQVASRGGVTEAALTVLAQKNFDSIIQTAIDAARTRSEELSK